MFWVLMEMSINTAINWKPRFLPTDFDQLFGYAEFKVEFHQIFIRARKDLEQKWYDLPYLATDDAIAVVLECWPTNWCTLFDLYIGSSKSTKKYKNEADQLKVQQLAKK